MADQYDYRDSFYDDEQDLRYPPIVEAIVLRTLLYFAEVLYNKLWVVDPQLAMNRILISDVEAGSNVAIGDAIDAFRSINHQFPFTAYNVGEFEMRTDSFNNQTLALGLSYYPEIGSKARAYPAKFRMQFVSFFNTALDHKTAQTILGSESSSLTRLYAPIMFGNTEVSIPFDVNFEIANGSLAGQFEEYLVQNRIWDLVHNVEILYHEYILDTVTIGQVDNMYVSLGLEADVRQKAVFGTVQIPNPPIISSTSPLDNAISVPVNSAISITFSELMQYNTVSVSIYPQISYSKSWVNKTLTITPWTNLTASTEYTITVKAGALTAEDQPLADDYVFNFFTV